MYTTVITCEQLADRYSLQHTVIVDCRYDLFRPTWGYHQYQTGHIPNAFFADVNSDLSSPILPKSGRHPLPDQKSFIQLIQSWNLQPNSQVVVYDQNNGGYAARLWFLMHCIGHQNVAILSGGFDRWNKQNYPVSKDIQKKNTALSQQQYTWNFDAVVNTPDVEQNMNNPVFQLIDARSNDRFHGENETIDPVAGHIPGALNYFHGKMILPETGEYKPAEQIKDELSALLNKSNLPPVVYCGSGVTSCNLLMGFVYAGLPAPKIYIGSWSEWIKNLDHPISK